jgi:tripartite-type tricarboxylate transporter receptor subunit TctC
MAMRTPLRILLVILLACAPLIAGAQAYPTKPVRMIVPYPAGGYYDLLARAIGQKLSEAWGQSLLVENRAGANGIVGTDYVAKSAADGYTIMMGGIGPHGINPSLYPKLPYDTLRDFAPVIHVATAPNVLVVHPSLEARSVTELIALARTRAHRLSYASNGSGSSNHLSAEMFSTAVGVQMIHVPYKGSAPAVTDLLGGQVNLLFGTMGDVVPHIRAGKLRALAVTGARRIAALPDVPTMIEAGVSGYESTAWFGVLAPAATPTEIVTRLNQDIGRTLQMPDVLEKITLQGSSDIIGGTPEQFGAFIRAEIAKWARVVKESGARAD